MKIRTATALTTTLFLLLAAACTSADIDNDERQREDAENTEQTEIKKSERNETDTEPEIDVKKQIISDLGIYVGKIDKQTVEIETNEGPKAFRLTEQSREQIKEFEPNDKVKFEYYINERQQNILQKAEKIDDKLTAPPESGIYNGQQESNSIEIETSHGPTVFQLSGKAKKQIDSLEIGGKVSFTYRVDGPQLIIESIEQIQ